MQSACLRGARPGHQSRSFDHFVGKGEQLGWDGDTERVGGLEIDHQMEALGLLNRKLRSLCALQQLGNIRGRSPQ